MHNYARVVVGRLLSVCCVCRGAAWWEEAHTAFRVDWEVWAVDVPAAPLLLGAVGDGVGELAHRRALGGHDGQEVL